MEREQFTMSYRKNSYERNPNHSPNSFWYRNRNHPSRGLYHNESKGIEEDNVQ